MLWATCDRFDPRLVRCRWRSAFRPGRCYTAGRTQLHGSLAQGAFKQAQHEYRESMSDMGAAADAGAEKGRDRFEVIAQLLSEADAFEAQARTVADIGQQYLDDAGAVAASPDENPGYTIRHWKVQVLHRTKLMMLGPLKPTESWISIHQQWRAVRAVRSAQNDLGIQRMEIAEMAGELRQVFESRTGSGELSADKH
jgi:hypothetical protein